MKEILHHIVPYQQRIETLIDAFLTNWGDASKLKEACAYALKNGGKRFRPALVLMIADSLNAGHSGATHAALAVELFHTASLIADDLPCMDNDDERRGVPALHVAFNEATALLASYALIAAGYDGIRSSCEDKPHLLPFLIENASFTTGILGASGGQFLDLYPKKVDISFLKEVIAKKTSALFELSFVLGYALGGGAMENISLVKKSAHHFGAAFQIADDFIDLAQDEKGEHPINAPLVLGKERAYAWLESEIEEFQKTLERLKLSHSPLNALVSTLLAYA